MITPGETYKADQANRKYTDLLHRVTISQAVMTGALELPELLGPLKERVFRRNLTSDTGLSQILLKGIVKGYTEKDLPFFAKALAEQTAINLEMVVSAAVIVLSHSTADDVFTGVCQLATELNPNEWIAELNVDKTIPLRDLMDKGKDEVFDAELTTFRDKIGRKSLSTRADLLFRHVKIRHHVAIPPTSSQYFRASELKIADDLRNEIVHGGLLPHIPVSRALELTMFLHEAASTAIRSIGLAFPLSIDNDYWQGLMAEKNPGLWMQPRQANHQP